MGISKRISIGVYVMAFVFLSCSTAKAPAVPPPKSPTVYFGYGGGFAGKEHSYSITDKGWVYSGDGEITPYQYIGRIQRAKAAQLVKLFSTLKLHQVEFQHPDNTYFFLGYRDDKSQHRIVWSNHRDVDTKVTDYYQLLMDVINPFLKNK